MPDFSHLKKHHISPYFFPANILLYLAAGDMIAPRVFGFVLYTPWPLPLLLGCWHVQFINICGKFLFCTSMIITVPFHCIFELCFVWVSSNCTVFLQNHKRKHLYWLLGKSSDVFASLQRGNVREMSTYLLNSAFLDQYYYVKRTWQTSFKSQKAIIITESLRIQGGVHHTQKMASCNVWFFYFLIFFVEAQSLKKF